MLALTAGVAAALAEHRSGDGKRKRFFTGVAVRRDDRLAGDIVTGAGEAGRCLIGAGLRDEARAGDAGRPKAALGAGTWGAAVPLFRADMEASAQMLESRHVASMSTLQLGLFGPSDSGS